MDQKAIETAIDIYEQKAVQEHQNVRLFELIMSSVSKFKLHVSGSRSEWSHQESADIDFMLSINGIDAISKADQAKRNNNELLFLDMGEVPGFAKLRLYQCYNRKIPYLNCTMSSLCISGTNIISTEKYLTTCSNTIPYVMPQLGSLHDTTTHGPCIKFSFTNCGIDKDIDVLYSLRCPEWPTAAENWITRNRQNGWPSNVLIDSIKGKGCHVVPIGLEKKTPRDAYWRFSFSVAEKLLFWSFTAKQKVCYSGLKYLLKSVIDQRLPGNFLCSYYLKTAMFWVIEDTDPMWWERAKLDQCLEKCLKKLILWMEKRECPNYFIPENNMFRGKNSNDPSLIAIIHSIMNERYVQEQSLLVFLSATFKKSSDDIGRFVCNQSIGRHVLFSAMTESNIHSTKAGLIDELRIIKQFPESKYMTLVKQQLSNSISCSLGYLLYVESTCIRNHHRQKQKKIAEKILVRTVQTDASACRLKLATYHFNEGNLIEVLKICTDINDVMQSGVLYCSLWEQTVHFCKKINTANISLFSSGATEFIQKHVIFDVVFLPSEIACVPDGVKYLLSDSTTVFLSTLVYVHLLKFLAYNELDDLILRDRALQKLISQTEDKNKAGLLWYNAFDLVGYCFLVLNNLHQAFKWLCKSASASIRYYGHATYWLLSVVAFKYLSLVDISHI